MRIISLCRLQIKITVHVFSLLVVAMGFMHPAFADSSPNNLGNLGLNNIPSARMDDIGITRVGISYNEPYTHGFIGFQIAQPLYINVRQSVERKYAKPQRALYPALDFKLRLQEESSKKPSVAFGIDSAIGHSRTSSEYITLSKRHHNFDFTGGVAWGRLAGEGHIRNPFAALGSHFDVRRDHNDSNGSNVGDWFTGEKIGFFGGVEYFTPMKGLSLKADYGGFDYDIEQAANAQFKAPNPYSIAVNYKPFKQADISIGTTGFESVMARLSLQGGLQNWFGRKAPKVKKPDLNFPRKEIEQSQILSNFLSLNMDHSTPIQIGYKAREIANALPIGEEEIGLNLTHKNLKGPKVTIIRRDLERSLLTHQSSAEEVWHDLSFSKPDKNKQSILSHFLGHKSKSLLPKFIFKNQISLAEEDSDVLYRSSAALKFEKSLPFGVHITAEPQVNLTDNISSIRDFRALRTNTIRGNEDSFAANRFALNRAYASWLYSISQDIHVGLSAGFLEEMIAGFGGEILYRPFGKTFAIGAESWRTRKRDSDSSLNLGLEDEEKFTGHLNLYYELPNTMTTFYSKIGQYLDEDLGATFGLQNTFKNDAKLDAFLTVSNEEERGFYNDKTNIYGGVKFTLPLGNITPHLAGSEAQFKVAPFARDKSQTLQRDNTLYALTEPIAYRHLQQNWNDLLK